jgi:hypothetical protein
MGVAARVSRMVAYLRAGYPTCMPAGGYLPLAALLPRRVSGDEITAIAHELIARRRGPISAVDVGVAITRVTNEMPSPMDIERVQHRLHAMGCPRSHYRRS